VKDAIQIVINQGIGSIPLSGQPRIGPNESTAYALTAQGPGGDATAKATVSVTLPPNCRESALGSACAATSAENPAESLKSQRLHVG